MKSVVPAGPHANGQLGITVTFASRWVNQAAIHFLGARVRTVPIWWTHNLITKLT